MPNSVSIPFSHGKVHEAKGFDETDSLQHEKAAAQNARLLFVLQHRKRYGLHAIIRWMSHSQSRIRFQYRKRYGLHAMLADAFSIWCEQSFNTASGMDCMQFANEKHPHFRGWFQYRKRYGLHAIKNALVAGHLSRGFNTASGMDCMQSWAMCSYCTEEGRFNTASGMDCMQ